MNNKLLKLRDRIETLDEKTLDKIDKFLDHKPKRRSLLIRIICAVDRFFDKTSRLWMYALELCGICFIIFFLFQFIAGIRLIEKGDSARGKEVIEATRISIDATRSMLISMFIALPSAIGILRTLNKKLNPGQQETFPQDPASALASVEMMTASTTPSDFSATPTD